METNPNKLNVGGTHNLRIELSNLRFGWWKYTN